VTVERSTHRQRRSQTCSASAPRPWSAGTSAGSFPASASAAGCAFARARSRDGWRRGAVLDLRAGPL
jgi:hypothetical protein